MKIVKIENIGKQPVYDISVEKAEHYVLRNGVVTHNTGIMLSSDNVWLVGRSQDKDGGELSGYNFTVRVEKSRYVREKSAIPITVRFEGGLSKFTGLLDIGLAANCIIKPSNGWYSRVTDDGVVEAKKWRSKDTDTAEFWESILSSFRFNEYVSNTYLVSNGQLVSDAEIDAELDDA